MAAPFPSVELTLDDIADLRAYERERDSFRARVIALKRDRRIPVGPFVSLVFENRETIRFQIQEMARAERISTDEGIARELHTYNPLISCSGRLSATLFLEFTSRPLVGTWLPRLVGIEKAFELRIGDAEVDVVRSRVDDDHEAHPTREMVTASVHSVWFPMTTEHAERLRDESACLACTHPAYRHEAPLTAANRRSLAVELL